MFQVVAVPASSFFIRNVNAFAIHLELNALRQPGSRKDRFNNFCFHTPLKTWQAIVSTLIKLEYPNFSDGMFVTIN